MFMIFDALRLSDISSAAMQISTASGNGGTATHQWLKLKMSYWDVNNVSSILHNVGNPIAVGIY